MKASMFNFLYPFDNDSYIAYNSFSGVLAIVSKDEYDFLSELSSINVLSQSEDFIESLKYGNFIIDDNVDELELLRFNLLRSRYSSNVLSLTIIPTSDCNFRCVYCYEKDVIHEEFMSIDVQNAIVDFVKERIKYIDSLFVTWFGGEPLLAIEIIETFSEKFLELCSEHNVQYSASIVSNGYLLSPTMLNRLKKVSINDMQITIDGTKETHDKRRGFKDGSPTFDVITNNLVECKENLIPTVIRINVDLENLESYYEVIDIFKEKGLYEKLFFYLSKVRNINDNYLENKCLNNKQFGRIYYKFLDTLDENVHNYNNYPPILSNYCMADSMSSLLIDSTGDLYKCWSDTGKKERSFGNILDKNCFEEFENNKAVMQYMMFDPTYDPACSQCSYLPICLGGCPTMRLNKLNDCTYYKSMLKDLLTRLAKGLIENPLNSSQQH